MGKPSIKIDLGGGGSTPSKKTSSGGSSKKSSGTRKAAAPPKSPHQRAVESVAYSYERKLLTDPYVIVTNKGTIKYTRNPKAKGVVKHGGGPVTRSQFYNKWGNLSDTFEHYNNSKATPKQVAFILRKGLTDYGVVKQLVNSKKFVGSLAWQQAVGNYEAVGKDIFGSGWDSKGNLDLMRRAVLIGLDSTGFANMLRKQKNYTESAEYKNKYATFNNTYLEIFGKPDATADEVTKKAVAEGWDIEQYKKYLRSQPNYGASSEFKNNAMSFAEAMGMMFGGTVTTGSYDPLADWNKPNG